MKTVRAKAPAVNFSNYKFIWCDICILSHN